MYDYILSRILKHKEKQMVYFFVDIEATGVDLENDRIIQIALIRKEGNEITALSDLCFTDQKMSYAAMAVHHITPEMIKDGYWPYETDTFRALEKENDASNYFITHGNELDLAMLENEELEIKMKCIDTDKCSRHLLKDAENYKLQTLRYQYGLYKIEKQRAEELGIGEVRAHDALSDVLWHYLLFEFLLEKVEGDADKLVHLTQTPILLEKITFGKYKNKNLTFEELFATDPGDFVWMYNHIARDWSDLEHTVEYWLKTNPRYWKEALEGRKRVMWNE
ncbi:MAG: 3'-5' exonuclease [Epsilonproteobacteria bacterium]|nr:MAG: 3'-5' exonuclease [Campylobacterota bacterium]